MGVIVDSSLLIAAESGRLDIRDLARESPEEELAIAGITAAELLHGVHRAKTPTQRTCWLLELTATVSPELIRRARAARCALPAIL
jgi:predicted nucleic acid-binding protein